MQARAATAPYARVKHWIRGQLARGRWPPGARMPSEAELVERFAVSRMTVGRALRELQREGLVERIQGAGTFAAQPGRVASTLTIRDLREEIVAKGHRHRVHVHARRRERADARVAASLGVAAGAEVFHTLLVHCDDDVPLQCEDRYVNPAAAPGYLDVDFGSVTPTQYLLRVAPVWELAYTVQASAPTALEARLLDVPRTAPCLVVVRRTQHAGVPITLARLVHPGHLYELQGDFRP